MNATFDLDYPFDLRWTPRQLADAVPLRLSELPAFDAAVLQDAAASANAPSAAPAPACRPTRRPYLPAAGHASGFRVR